MIGFIPAIMEPIEFRYPLQPAIRRFLPGSDSLHGPRSTPYRIETLICSVRAELFIKWGILKIHGDWFIERLSQALASDLKTIWFLLMKPSLA